MNGTARISAPAIRRSEISRKYFQKKEQSPIADGVPVGDDESADRAESGHDKKGCDISLVATRHYISGLSALIHGQQWRRRRRSHGPDRAAGLSRWLGVDAVWISPIYPSPMKDFGYDVADYTAIHPLFGTLADFDRLIERGACARPESHPRFCPQSQFRPASMVC